MWKSSKIASLFIITFHGALFPAQRTQQDSIQTYLQQLSKLIETEEHLQKDMLSNSFLLAYNTQSQNKEPLLFSELFTLEKEKNNLLLSANNNIKEVIQENKILELENIAQRKKINSVVIALVILLVISGQTVISYLRIKRKNKLLISRATHLTKIHLRMKEKLADYQKTPSKKVVQKAHSDICETHSKIDEDVKDIILSKLKKLEKEHFFLDANCNLHQLAEQLKTNPKYLSQVINQSKKTNFNNYINELRINYLLPKLVSDLEFRNNKLNYIAVSLGYNNLNTFNAAFKKRIGLLPSNFIEKLNNEGHSRNVKAYIPSHLLGSYN